MIEFEWSDENGHPTVAILRLSEQFQDSLSHEPEKFRSELLSEVTQALSGLLPAVLPTGPIREWDLTYRLRITALGKRGDSDRVRITLRVAGEEAKAAE